MDFCNITRACRATRFIFLAFGLSISSWAPMVPFAKTRLGLDDAQLGLVLLVFGIGALVTMPFSGWLVQRYGSRLITLLSGLLMITVVPSAGNCRYGTCAECGLVFLRCRHWRFECIDQCPSRGGRS